MHDVLRSRAAFLLWAFLACPALAWWFTLFVAGSDGGVSKFVLLFVVLPGALAFGAGLLAHRPFAEIGVGTIAAAVLGGLTWVLTIVYLASQGVFDTAPVLG